MANQWFYMSNGQQQGPISSDQLKELAVSGQLVPADMVWLEGTADWVSASTVENLFPTKVENVPPPLPQSIPPAAPPAIQPPSVTQTPAQTSSIPIPPSNNRRNMMSDTNNSVNNNIFGSIRVIVGDGTYLNKGTYRMLAILFGVFGLHDFYANRRTYGWVHMGLVVPLFLCVFYHILVVSFAGTGSGKDEGEAAFMALGQTLQVVGNLVQYHGLASWLTLGSWIWALIEIRSFKEEDNISSPF